MLSQITQIAEKDEKPCKQEYSRTAVHKGVTKEWPPEISTKLANYMFLM